MGEEFLPDASVPEDRGTVFGGVGERPKTIGTEVGADTSAVGRRSDEIICRSLPEKRSDFWNRSAPRGSLEEETTHQQFERGSGRLSGANGS